jgi:hypothetical protein
MDKYVGGHADPKVIAVLYQPICDSVTQGYDLRWSYRDLSLLYAERYLSTKVHGLTWSQWLFSPRRLASEMTYRDLALTFSSLVVTLRTTRFYIKEFYVVPTLRLCVLYGSQNKQQLLPYKTLRDWFL